VPAVAAGKALVDIAAAVDIAELVVTDRHIAAAVGKALAVVGKAVVVDSCNSVHWAQIAPANSDSGLAAFGLNQSRACHKDRLYYDKKMWKLKEQAAASRDRFCKDIELENCT
jgi:hypothetical protein